MYHRYEQEYLFFVTAVDVKLDAILLAVNARKQIITVVLAANA